MNANTLTDDLLHLSGTCIKELIWNSYFSLSWMDIEKIFFVDTSIWAPILLKQSQKYGCLFVAKLSWKKKKIVFSKNIYVFYKISIIYRKKYFYMEKKFHIEKFFCWKKYKWKCKKHVSHLRNIFLYRKCLC